jgi:hemerythrin-like metal-binding protein
VESLIDAFVQHIVDHFNTEEALMENPDHPAEQQHREVHHKLLERANQLNRRFHRSNGNQVVRDLVSFIAYDVVAQHLILEDPKIAHAALGRSQG